MSPTARTHTRNTHGNAPRHLWSTQNRTPGKIPWREARPLPAKHTTHHFRIQRPCFRVHGLGFRGLGAGFGFTVSCVRTVQCALPFLSPNDNLIARDGYVHALARQSTRMQNSGGSHLIGVLLLGTACPPPARQKSISLSPTPVHGRHLGIGARGHRGASGGVKGDLMH